MSNDKQPAQNLPQQPAKKFEEGTLDAVLSKISAFVDAGELVLPANYVPANAVRSAWLLLQETKDKNDNPALSVCTATSIANAMLEMVIKGLSVVKKQCYFVVYGNKLELEKSYIGEIAMAKRDANVKDVKAVVIYEKDVFEYVVDTRTGRKSVTKHEQKFENIDNEKIKGAYAIVEYTDGSIDTEIMTMPQIYKAWAQGGSRGSSPAHKNFPDQMAIKTVINRALKIVNGSTDDSTLVQQDQVSAGVSHQIRENANRKELTMEEPTANEPVVAPTEEIEGDQPEQNPI